MKKLIFITLLLLLVPFAAQSARVLLDESVDSSLDGNSANSTGKDLRLTIFQSLASQNTMNDEVYAQYATQWYSGEVYEAENFFVVHGGAIYVCTANHTAGSDTEPGVGVDWTTTWSYWGGSSTTWDSIGDATAASEIDLGSYVSEINTEDFQIGDGTSNYFRIWLNGSVITLTPVGNAVIQGSFSDSSVGYDALAADAKFQSLTLNDLADPTTPSVLTVEETTNKIISNYQTTGADHVLTSPTCHDNYNAIYFIGDEFQLDLEPDSGTAFYLNGTQMAVDEHIQNTADTVGESMTCFAANINGTCTVMCESKYTNFVEATP